MALIDKLKAIANAIRSKTGKAATMSLDEMPTEIEAIETSNTDNEDAFITRTLSGKYVNDRITKVGAYAFYVCSQLAIVDLSQVEIVGEYGFYGCYKLREVLLPSVVDVGMNAFRDCYVLETIDLCSIGTIPQRAFQGAKTLTTIVLRRSDSICTLSDVNAFQNTPLALAGAGGRVYVPLALIEIYRTATNWSVLHEAGTCEFVAIEGSEYE